MCFWKKADNKKIDEQLFIYLCDDYFKDEKPLFVPEYDELINATAIEFLPDIDKLLVQDSELTVEKVSEICRRLAVKTLLLLALKDDTDNSLFAIVENKYAKELKGVIKDVN